MEFSRLSNCKEVRTLLTSLQLVNYASGLSAFTYQDANLRIVFLQENLSQHEQMILLSHELGAHFVRTPEPGRHHRAGVRLWRSRRPTTSPPGSCATTRPAGPGARPTLIALCLAVLVLAAVVTVGAVHRENPTVYLTESGQCYHKADCKYIVGKDNTTAVTLRQAKASGYDPCTWCFGHSGT